MPERTYLDTSFLLKAYVSEADSTVVVNFLQQQTGQLIVSSLTHVEVASSLFRKLPMVEAQQSLAVYRNNCKSGAFEVLTIDEAIYKLAELLAEQHCHSLQLRSLDLLHLATALEHGATSLATYDKKLRMASEASGLAVVGARP